MSKKTSSSRQYRREQMQARIRRQRLIAGGAIGLAVVAIVALGLYARQADEVAVSEVTLPPSLEVPANADGAAWGPEDAAVFIEEYGDYQ